MAMSEAQKKLRRWFQRHKWSTGCTPTGRGAYLEAPIQKGINYVSWPYYKDGTLVPEEKRYRWHVEYIPQFEIDRMDPSRLEIGVYKRDVYTAGPDYETKNKPWSNHPETFVYFSYDELVKIVELMKVCIDENRENEKRWKRKRQKRELHEKRGDADD